MRPILVFIWILAFLAYTHVHALNPYVQSLEDFVIHTLAHKERVVELAVAHLRYLQAKDPGRWGHLSENVVRAQASLHDNPKLEVQNARKLYDYYGLNKNHFSSKEKKIFEEFIAKLEREEKNIRPKFLINSQAYEDLNHIIFIADQVDRGLDPVTREEMGKITRLASTKSYLTSDRAMVLALEKNYWNIRGHSFFEVKERLPKKAFEIWAEVGRVFEDRSKISICVLGRLSSQVKKAESELLFHHQY